MGLQSPADSGALWAAAPCECSEDESPAVDSSTGVLAMPQAGNHLLGPFRLGQTCLGLPLAGSVAEQTPGPVPVFLLAKPRLRHLE